MTYRWKTGCSSPGGTISGWPTAAAACHLLARPTSRSHRTPDLAAGGARYDQRVGQARGRGWHGELSPAIVAPHSRAIACLLASALGAYSQVPYPDPIRAGWRCVRRPVSTPTCRRGQCPLFLRSLALWDIPKRMPRLLFLLWLKGGAFGHTAPPVQAPPPLCAKVVT